MHRRALTAALASATVALGGAIAAPTVPAQAEDPSPIELRAPAEQTVQSHRGWVSSDFGVRMIARGEHFTVHARRSPSGEQSWWDTTYNSPITATWKRESGDVELGELKSWQGLDRFVQVQVFQKGERIRNRFSTSCLNGRSRKIGPGAPEGPANPFPSGCPWNPYTLGSVMGVAQDHSAPLLSQWETRMRLAPGRYQLVAGIAPKWQSKLGIDEADAAVTSTLVVEKAGDRRGRFDRATATRRSGDDGLEATTEAPTSDSRGAMASEYAPDLRSLPAFDISMNGKGTAMRFGATVWNGGAGPMVIEGFREPRGNAARGPGHDDGPHMTAYQYYFDGNGNQTGYDQVGEFNYHSGNHDHWHFRDFARYRLFAADPETGEPGELAVKSTKASFCLVATDAVDLTVPNADMRPEYTDLGSQCGGEKSRKLRQVLANGHGDTYHQFRTGQAFRIGDQERVPDGDYFISVESNPDDATGRNLQELDYSNNDSYRKVRIWTAPNGKRKVRAYPVGIIDESDFGGFFRR